MPEPERLVLRLLQDMREEMRGMRSEMGDMRSEMASKKDLAALGTEIRSEVHSLRADVASDFLDVEKRLNNQLVSLRRSVMEYHSATIGHGMLYSELEERVRRLEQRLDLSPSEPH